MRKAVLKEDLIMVLSTKAKKVNCITPLEAKEVLCLTNESAYVLYSAYKTFPFKVAKEITDTEVGKALGWQTAKVQRNRLLLEKNNLFRLIRYGTKFDGVTRVYVGVDVVALCQAGQ